MRIDGQMSRTGDDGAVGCIVGSSAAGAGGGKVGSSAAGAGGGKVGSSAAGSGKSPFNGSSRVRDAGLRRETMSDRPVRDARAGIYRPVGPQ